MAILEAFVVLLQGISILPVKDPSFLCTGTWVNPNVTAMFLSLSLFAVLQVSTYMRSRGPRIVIVSVIVLAILLLYCRSAYLVTILFLYSHYRQKLKSIFQSVFSWTIVNVATLVLLFALLIVFISPFLTKKDSMSGRVTIWQNSIVLAVEKPFSGHEFGRFERDYNLHAASLRRSNNSHVNMAYNDFLEIAVEGGIFAVLCWAFFLFSFFRFCVSRKRSLLPLSGIAIIQLTNFGFQAIPVLSLFIIYAATGNRYLTSVANPANKHVYSSYTGMPGVKLIYASLLVAAVYFLFSIGRITSAYYSQKLVHDNLKNIYAVVAFKKLEPMLEFSNGFYEHYGDALMFRRQFRLAVSQFRKALSTCSRPDLFAKCGYCYMRMKNYDSSRYYYQMVENLEPNRLIPRMALLKLYEEEKDTCLILIKAREIVELPMRNVTKRGIEIKNYAKQILNAIDSLRNNISIQKFIKN